MPIFYQYQVINGVGHLVPYLREQVVDPGNYPSDVHEPSYHPSGYASGFHGAPNQPLEYRSNATYYAGAAPPPSFQPPEQLPPTPMPDVWLDRENIRPRTKMQILNKGIGHFLCELEDYNFRNSPQRWSEFPEDEPEDVDIPGRYQTTVSAYLPHLKKPSLMQCQRCGTLCDWKYRVVENKDGAAARVDYILPYVHCPLNSVRRCHNMRRRDFTAAEHNLIVTGKLESWRNLERHLVTLPASKIDASVFGEEESLAPATREIFNAYRCIRTVWHLMLTFREEDPEDFREEDSEILDRLPVWGDLVTDVTLLQTNLISENNIRFVYGISLRGADYLYRWQSEWTRELEWLNTYAGMSRNEYKNHPRVPIWRDVASKIGLALVVLADAQEMTNGTWENLQTYREANILVRSLFRELHSCLMRVACDV
ncbi:hypothetical protein E4U42_006274 [Claviceps africana]|uniref:Uncharacterized protein n=1 Tax=Claviceps africana TaxID=83212 RepID=A0A8K0NGW4_9HYPO|nr:hypothetical protein E4U42_006274 [Claviceps africana]